MGVLGQLLGDEHKARDEEVNLGPKTYLVRSHVTQQEEVSVMSNNLNQK